MLGWDFDKCMSLASPGPTQRMKTHSSSSSLFKTPVPFGPLTHINLLPPCLFLPPFAYSTSFSWVSAYLYPVNKTDMDPCPSESNILVRETDIHQTWTETYKCTLRLMLGWGEQRKTTHGAWFQRDREGFCSLARNLDYKLPHESENPSQGETMDNLGWQLIQLASPWLRVGICICWTNRWVNQQATL